MAVVHRSASDALVVVHLLDSLRPSGMEKMLQNGSTHFNREGIHNVIVGQGEFHPYLDALRIAGLDCQLVPSLWSGRGRRAFRRILSEKRASIVHIHSERTYFAAVFAAPRDVALVRTIHSYFEPKGWKKLLKGVINALSDRRCSALVAPTLMIANHERKKGRSVLLVPNWIDARFFDGDAESHSYSDDVPSSLVLVGNCSTIKRHPLVLRAAVAFGVPVVHVGDEDHASPEESRLLDLLAVRGLLRYRGSGDPLPWLGPNSLFCMPSSREGMGMALAEALVMGSPALISRSPGLEWAAGFEGVAQVRDDDWTHMIAQPIVMTGKRFHRDLEFLRPEHGVSEYSRLYRKAAGLTRSEGE